MENSLAFQLKIVPGHTRSGSHRPYLKDRGLMGGSVCPTLPADAREGLRDSDVPCPAYVGEGRVHMCRQEGRVRCAYSYGTGHGTGWHPSVLRVSGQGCESARIRPRNGVVTQSSDLTSALAKMMKGFRKYRSGCLRNAVGLKGRGLSGHGSTRVRHSRFGSTRHALRGHA